MEYDPSGECRSAKSWIWPWLTSSQQQSYSGLDLPRRLYSTNLWHESLVMGSNRSLYFVVIVNGSWTSSVMSKYILLHFPPPPLLWINPIETIWTCILIFFSLKKKGVFVRQALFWKHFNERSAALFFFFPGEPWNPKSYRDFRETGPCSWTQRYLGRFLFIKKLNPAVKTLSGLIKQQTENVILDETQVFEQACSPRLSGT